MSKGIYPVIGRSSVYMLAAVIPVAVLAGLCGSLMGLVILKVLNWKERLKTRYEEMLFVLLSIKASGIDAAQYNTFFPSLFHRPAGPGANRGSPYFL